MHLKSAVLALSLCLLGVAPGVTFADTLTLTGTPGGSTDGINIYPYQMTYSGPGGTASILMSCLNFDREIVVGESWTVEAVNVASIPSIGLDFETQAAYRADAWLFNQYGTSAGTNSEIQFAIWSIMDPSAINAIGGVPTYDGFDATAQALAKTAATRASTLPTSYYASDMVFVPTSDTTGWTNGPPQIFMTDPPPPAVTPEPSSLLLFGTGLLGTVFIMRRKVLKASPLS